MNGLPNDTAWIVELCRQRADAATDQDIKRLWSMAQVTYENAGMWAVKAATTEPAIK